MRVHPIKNPWDVAVQKTGHYPRSKQTDVVEDSRKSFKSQQMRQNMPERQEKDIHYDDTVGAHFGKSRALTQSELAACVFRFDELPSSPRAFIDAALPGHRRTLMGALGGGAADEDLASQVTHAENYHIDYIHAAPGNGAALHSHDTEETFICLTGKWKVATGDDGETAVVLNYLDGVVCPAGVMRAFENVGEDDALLLSILGGKHPGHVVWADCLQAPLVASATASEKLKK